MKSVGKKRMSEHKKIFEFIKAIKITIHYEKSSGRDLDGMLNGLTFSILCMLDGYSGYFDGNIDDIAKESHHVLMHEFFYNNLQDNERK